MMKDRYKITSLYVSNFKCFEEQTFDFQNKDLIVLDGPNGYGKTTLFDTIELIIKGKIRRIDENDNINSTYAYNESSLHLDDSKEIVLELKLSSQTDSLIIKRTFESANNRRPKEKNPKNIFEFSSLVVSQNGNDFEQVSSEKLELEILNYKKAPGLFNVLNYVEQDENTYFLKKSPKKKYRGLVSILGIEEEQKKLLSLESFHLRLSKMINSKKDELEQIKKSNKEILSKDINEVEYKKILSVSEINWDNENLLINSESIRDSFLRELEKVINVKKNYTHLDDIIYLTSIKEYLTDKFLTNLKKYYWSFQNIEILKKENENRVLIDNALKKLKPILSLIEYYNILELSTATNELKTIKDEKLIKNYLDFNSQVKTLANLKKTLSSQSQKLSDLNRKRESLIEHFKEHNQDGHNCPTCGYDWKTSENLLKSFDETKMVSSQFLDLAVNNFNKEEEVFKEKWLNDLKENTQNKVNELNQKKAKLIDETYFSDILQKEKILNSSFSKFFALLKKDNKARILDLINKRNINPEKNIVDEIRDYLNNTLPTFEGLDDPEELYNDFKKYFDNNLEEVKDLKLIDIDIKKKYIQYSFYNYLNNGLRKKQSRINKLKKLIEDTDTIISTYRKSIEQYIQSIISTISIPFYIFSGKILQEHMFGSGLIFNADLKKSEPQLKITPLGKSQEASYTLSSGQLSATVMALTLVLNKVYNSSKLGLILIDDPLQTLDEINTHSLIEVLKYNFSDQQLILSTHEDRYSKFIRYKYDKFGLNEKNINLKNI